MLRPVACLVYRGIANQAKQMKSKKKIKLNRCCDSSNTSGGLGLGLGLP